MNNNFQQIREQIKAIVYEWEPLLTNLPVDIITERKNSQNRSIKQIVGHMIDSASNNTHRMVHLQYQKSPFDFPNYATNGNNDRWIAIQNYQNEDWHTLIQLWKYANLHICHVIANLSEEKLTNKWLAGEGQFISLNNMVISYLPHLQLHIDEIKVLIDQAQ